MLLHVSVCDHHQEPRTWVWLKLKLLKMFCKIRRYEHELVWQHAATPLHVHKDRCMNESEALLE
jgi:hypothetical protein